MPKLADHGLLDVVDLGVPELLLCQQCISKLLEHIAYLW